MISFNKAKTPSEKEHYAAEIISQAAFKNAYPLSQDQFEYYSQWYHITLREILTLKDRPQSSQDIADSLLPGVSRTEVDEAFELLTRLNLIEKRGDALQVKDQNVETGEAFSNYGVVRYHKKMIQLGAEALDRFSSDEREISSVTIGLSEANFKKIKQMIVDFRSQLMKISEEDQGRDHIYQYNFQVFPLTRRRDK